MFDSELERVLTLALALVAGLVMIGRLRRAGRVWTARRRARRDGQRAAPRRGARGERALDDALDEAARRGAYLKRHEAAPTFGPRRVVLTLEPGCRVPFHRPLPFPLRVSPGAGQATGLRVGHPAFDAAFVVETPVPELAREVLSAALCEALLRHPLPGAVVLDARGLRHRFAASWRAHAGDGVPELVDRLQRLCHQIEPLLPGRAALLERLARGQVRPGPMVPDLGFVPPPRPPGALPEDARRHLARGGVDVDRPFRLHLSRAFLDDALLLHVEARQEDARGHVHRAGWSAPVLGVAAGVLSLHVQEARLEPCDEATVLGLLACLRGLMQAHGRERWSA